MGVDATSSSSQASAPAAPPPLSSPPPASPAPSAASPAQPNASPPPRLPRNAAVDVFHDPRPLPEVEAKTLENYNGAVDWKPKHAYSPASLDELSRVISSAGRQYPNLKIKAGGSRNSYTAAATDGIYIHPDKMQFIASVSAKDDALRTDLPADMTAHLVRSGSGTTIRNLNAELWKRGLAMPVLGGYDGQTVGGALPTGTHGSVLNSGPLVSLVRSMDMVRADGKKVRIEPKNGITDPAAFRRMYPDMELIQDDEVFNASLVTIGTFGVVYSYVLATTDKFYLDEVRTITDLADVKNVLSGGNVYNRLYVDAPPPGTPKDDPKRVFAGQPARTYHMEVLFNPYSGKAVVTTRTPVKVDKEPEGLDHRQNGNLFSAISLGPQYTRPVFGTWLQEVFHAILAFFLDLLAGIFPSLVPKLTDAALDSLKDDAYIQRSYNVFNIGDGANAIPTQSCELFVPLRNDEYLKAIDVLRDAARKWSELHGTYQTGPISMRFIKGSSSPMLPNEDYASFEIIFAGHTPYAQEMLTFYKQALDQAFGKDVKYHWGQLSSNISAADVVSHYPGYPAWRAVHDRFDPQGKFINAWQEKFLPPLAPAAPRTPTPVALAPNLAAGLAPTGPAPSPPRL